MCRCFNKQKKNSVKQIEKKIDGVRFCHHQPEPFSYPEDFCVKSPDLFLYEMLPTVDALFPTSWAPLGLAPLRWNTQDKLLYARSKHWVNDMVKWKNLAAGNFTMPSIESSKSATVIQSSLRAYHRTVQQLHASIKLSRTGEAYHQQHHVNLASVRCG